MSTFNRYEDVYEPLDEGEDFTWPPISDAERIVEVGDDDLH
jgi:hypothetical protein